MARTAFGGTGDNTRVDSRYFERPSVPQSGPINAVIPLDLPRDQFEVQHYGAIAQQANSFRSQESLPRDKFHRPSIPQQAPLYVVGAELEFDPATFPSSLQLSASYRLRSRLPIDQFIRTDFAHAPPLYAVSNNLDWTFVPADFPAISQLSNSFRSKPARSIDPRPEWVQPAWIAAAGNHLEVDPVFQPAFSQQANTFRLHDLRHLTEHKRTDFPQQAPLYLEPAPPVGDLYEVFHFPALQQTSRSFRAPDGPKLQVAFYDWIRRDWISKPAEVPLAPRVGFGGTSDSTRVESHFFPRPSTPQQAPLFVVALDLFPPDDLFVPAFWPALGQQLGSFRADEQYRDIHRRTDFPQSAPLTVLQTGVLPPADAYLAEFSPALEQHRSFRAPDREKFRPQFYQSVQVAWIFAELVQEVFDVNEWPAIEQLRDSFRVKDPTVNIYEYFISRRGVAVLFLEPKHFVPTTDQARRSFRVGLIQDRDLNVLQSHLYQWIQNAPIFTIPVDLPRDKFEPQFWPSMVELSRSFRARDIEPVVPRFRAEFVTEFQTGWIQLQTVISGPGGVNQNQFRDSRRR